LSKVADGKMDMLMKTSLRELWQQKYTEEEMKLFAELLQRN
jgi:hypothetical protein